MDSLFSLGEDNQFLKDTLEDDWDNFNEEATSEEINLNSLLNEIHHTITITEFRKKKKKSEESLKHIEWLRRCF